MSFFFYERQQRRAFLETRQSLETKLILEEESQEQVSNFILVKYRSTLGFLIKIVTIIIIQLDETKKICLFFKRCCGTQISLIFQSTV